MTNTATKNFEKTVSSLKVTGTLHANKLQVGDDWKPYNVTVGGGWSVAGTILQRMKYRIVGTTLYVKGILVSSGDGTHIDATYTFSLPPGCTLANYTSDIGMGVADVIGTTVQHMGTINALSSSTFGIYMNKSNTPDETILTYYGGSTDTITNLRCSATTQVIVCCNFTAELSPTCAAVMGLQP